jgi:hypothetical protein
MAENDDYMEFEFEPDENWNSMDYIGDMKGDSRQMMMDVVFSAIINNEYGVVNSLSKLDTKVGAIEHVLYFFEEREDYEKCAALKKVIDKIK